MMTARRRADLSALTENEEEPVEIDTTRRKNDIPDFSEQLGATGESTSAVTKNIAEMSASVAEVTKISQMGQVLEAWSDSEGTMTRSSC